MDFLLSSFMDTNLYAMEGEDKDEKQRHGIRTSMYYPIKLVHNSRSTS